MDPQVEAAIRNTAAKHGIDPALMMAIAERESSFNPNAGSGSPHSSAYGLFQLLKRERAQYGGSSNNPTEQSEAWANYIGPVKDEMTGVLGREPTGPELYLGHYFGGVRGARIAAGHFDPNLPVDAIFSPKEMAANPNFGRAGTVGRLSSSILGDVDRRMAKHGGGGFSGETFTSGTPARAPKKDMYPGELVEAQNEDPVAALQKLELPPVQTFELGGGSDPTGSTGSTGSPSAPPSPPGMPGATPVNSDTSAFPPVQPLEL